MSHVVIGGARRPAPIPIIEPGAPNLPEVAYTDDGLAAVIATAGGAVRFNDVQHAVEVRLPGTDAWVHGDDEVIDDLMVECSKVARGASGSRVGPWRIPGARLEKRLLGVVARRDRYDGPGDDVYQAVTAYTVQVQASGTQVRATLTAIMRESDSLFGWETGPRANHVAKRSAKAALLGAGWEWRKGRVGKRAPQMLWHAPGGTEGINLVPK